MRYSDFTARDFVLAVKESLGAKTHGEFIERTGVQARDYYRWISEKDERRPSFVAVMRLLDAAGVPLPSGERAEESGMRELVEKMEALADQVEQLRSEQAQ